MTVIFNEKIQVKAAIKPGGKQQWNIHKGLLKPDRTTAASFGFPLDAHGTGMEGGVLLMEVTPSNVDSSIEVVYGFIDIYVLAAIQLDVISLRQQAAQEVALSLYKRIQGATREMVVVTRGAFLRAQSVEHLLALMGLHSRIQTNWHHLLTRLAENEFLPGAARALPAPVEVVKENVAQEIGFLTSSRLKYYKRPPNSGPAADR